MQPANLFYNHGFGTYLLSIDGRYYRRSHNSPWHLITEEQAGELHPVWQNLHALQEAAYLPALPG